MSQNSNERGALIADAEHRLMDAALEELLLQPPAAGHPAIAPSPQRSAAPSRWLVAATLLLGCGVVAALLVTRGAGIAGEAELQQPELPPPVVAEGVAQLRALDAGTQNLELTVVAPRDLAPLARLTKLRALHLFVEASSDTFELDEQAWREAGAAALAPLRDCVELESLTIGYASGFDPRACRVLRELPKLRDLRLIGVRQLVDREFGATLSKLALQRLRLLGVRFTRQGFASLCELPVLRRLTLESCLHLDRCDLGELGKLRQLRQLTLRGVGGRFAHALSRSHPLPGEKAAPTPPGPGGPGVVHTGLPMPGEVRRVLTVEAVHAIAALPALRELSLRDSVVGDELLAALPEDLVALDLCGAIGLTPAAVPKLSRMTALSRLAFSTGGVDAPPGGAAIDPDQLLRAWCAELPRWPLRSLVVRGAVDAALSQAIARCQSLTAVELVASLQSEVDLAFVAQLPALRELKLRNLQRIDPAQLRAAAELRRVEARGLSQAALDALRAALDARDVELVVR